MKIMLFSFNIIFITRNFRPFLSIEVLLIDVFIKRRLLNLTAAKMLMLILVSW